MHFPLAASYETIGAEVIDTITKLEDKNEARELLIAVGKDIPPIDYANILGLNTSNLSPIEKSNLTIGNVCNIYLGFTPEPEETYSLNSQLELRVSGSEDSEKFELVDVSNSHNNTPKPSKTLSPTPEDIAALSRSSSCESFHKLT